VTSRLARFLVLAAAPVVAAACGGATSNGSGTSGTPPSSAGNAKTGGQAPDFATRDIKGKTVKLSDYLGKQAILIDFWATYCEPCLAEMPHLRTLYDNNKEKGFVVLAISMDGPETVADVPSFAKRNAMTFPVLLDEDSRITSLYNPKKSAPLSVLIDKNGKVVEVHEGYNPGDENQIAASISNVLDPKAPVQ
jgi:peroxiredoxin